MSIMKIKRKYKEVLLDVFYTPDEIKNLVNYNKINLLNIDKAKVFIKENLFPYPINCAYNWIYKDKILAYKNRTNIIRSHQVGFYVKDEYNEIKLLIVSNIENYSHKFDIYNIDFFKGYSFMALL